MKKAMLVLCLAAAWFHGRAQDFEEKDFQPLHGLIGLWKMETKRGSVFEEWVKENDTRLVGRSFRVSGTDTSVTEEIELFYNDRQIVYSPTVKMQNNGQAVSFRLISNAGGRYVFENKEHDFPQRVIYHIRSADSVIARIEGKMNGRDRGADFKFNRLR